MGATAGHIAIVGGGTAGWLSALVLQKSAQKSLGENNQVRISVIESPNIPTVGVGEGSTAIFRQVLLDLDIDEAEFLRETGATFKFGIRHEGWRKDGGHYFGPIDDPQQLVPKPEKAPESWLHLSRIASGKDIESAHLFTWLMKAKKSPYTSSGLDVGPFHYAYHFDQAKLGLFLATKASGIQHIKAEVSDIVMDSDNGSITALGLTDGDNLDVDFVVDCTGFRRAIMSKLKSKWHSYSDILPLNKAMPFWLEHEGDKDINSYTLSQALSSGWRWEIPTIDRVGSGYVFSDVHLSPEQAQKEVELKLGRKIEPRGLIPINPGRQVHAWIRNCVSIGLSQSFLEPLEATSIHGTLVQLLLLTQTRFNDLLSGNFKPDQDRYNETVAGQLDDFAHFINIHYAGGRQDSEFWRDMHENHICKTSKERLAIWQNEPVRRDHFPQFPASLPHVEEQLYIPVLDGLGLLPTKPSKDAVSANKDVRAAARKTLERLITEFKSASRMAMGHRNYLQQLHNA